MKNLTILLFLLISYAASSQKMVVGVNPSSAQLFLKSVPVGNAKKVNVKDVKLGIVAVKEGYATMGYSFKELKEKGGDSFTISLDEVKSLPEGYSSKSIEFKEISDRTGMVERPDRFGLYGIPIAGTELNTPPFINAVVESFSNFGYSMSNASSKFEDAGDTRSAELAVAAELLYFSKDTRGDGFQISLVVEWTVYSFAEKKIILTTRTGGYSDKAEPKFNNELPYTLQDAVVGLLNSEEFQNIAKK